MLERLWNHLCELPKNKKQSIVGVLLFVIGILALNNVEFPFVSRFLLHVGGGITFILFYLFWLPMVYYIIFYWQTKHNYFYFWLGYALGLLIYRINRFEWDFSSYDYFINFYELISCLFLAFAIGILCYGFYRFINQESSRS